MKITLLRLALSLAGSVVLPLGSGLPLLAAHQQSGQQATAKPKAVQMRITGMTCAACAKGLEASFRNMAGILKADVDYKGGQAIITLDTTKQSAESVSKSSRAAAIRSKKPKVV